MGILIFTPNSRSYLFQIIKGNNLNKALSVTLVYCFFFLFLFFFILKMGPMITLG